MTSSQEEIQNGRGRTCVCFIDNVSLVVGFPGGSVVKNLPAGILQVGSLVREDLLEQEMATHSSILAWEIPCTEDPGGLQSMGSQSRTELTVYTTATIPAIWCVSLFNCLYALFFNEK